MRFPGRRTCIDPPPHDGGVLQVRRLPVLNHDKRLVGMLSLY
jgi:hypothetical protein